MLSVQLKLESNLDVVHSQFDSSYLLSFFYLFPWFLAEVAMVAPRVVAIHHPTLGLVATLGDLATMLLVDREAAPALLSVQHLPLSALNLGIASVLLIGKEDLDVGLGLVGGQGTMVTIVEGGEEVSKGSFKKTKKIIM